MTYQHQQPYGGWPPQMPATPPQKHRRNATIALIVIPIVVIAAAFAGVALFWDRGGADGDGGRPVKGQLRGTYPTMPAAGWRLSADEVFDGAVFVRPDPTSNQYARPGFIDLGDTLITQAVLPQSDRGYDLVAIDAKSGRIRWQTTIESGEQSMSGLDVSPAACASKVVDGLLACVVEKTVQFFSMSDGSLVRRLAAPERASIVEVHGPDVYTLGFQMMARGTTTDLTASWSETYSDSGPGCAGSGDAHYFGVTDHVVWFGTDGGVVVASVDDGHRLIDGDPQWLRQYGDRGFTGDVCREGGVPTETVVADNRGAVLRSVAPNPGGNGVTLVPEGADVPYFSGGGAYDFATGKERWTGAPGITLNSIIGDVVLGNAAASDGFGDGSLAAYDLASGQPLWTNEAGGSVEMSDGAKVLVGREHGTAAINLATGQEDWVMDGQEILDLAQAGDGFASVSKDEIVYYPPTGGPSVAPGRGGQPDAVDAGGEGGLITKCGRVPEMRPVEYRAESGALVVKMEIKATCPGGDVITTNKMRITVRDGRGTICSGVFDFSSNPLTLGAKGSEATVVELRFDAGSILRHPNTLGDRSGSDPGATTANAKGDELVDCEDEGTSAGPPGGGTPPKSTGTKVFADEAGAVGDCGSDAEALQALRIQVDGDRPVVQSDLADRWVAQLSSKQPGLVAPDTDGVRMVTWTPCEILRQHLRLRLKYPEVRLVWSDEWRTFDLRGWWVTIAGLTFGDSAAANRWCDDRAIPVDECYAKVISNNRDSSGSTDYRR
jgi:putative pyrroloquinoline-quinone binding quinoprotein